MQLRFRVNQAEAFRLGISVPKSIVWVDVEPGELDESTRNLIADRMDGVDVRPGYYDDVTKRVRPMHDTLGGDIHVEAKLNTLEALVEAVREDQERVERENSKFSSKFISSLE